MKKQRTRLDTIHVVLFASVAVLAVYAAVLTHMVIEMNTYSENRDNFIMDRVFELQVDKWNREAQE